MKGDEVPEAAEEAEDDCDSDYDWEKDHEVCTREVAHMCYTTHMAMRCDDAC